MRPGLPSDLARIVRRCLKKDPRHRLQTARDVSNEFRDLARTASRPTSVSAAAPRMATPSDSDAARVDGGFWVAVLPLKYSGSNQDLRALAEGLSEEIVTGLSRFSYLRVMVHHGGRISVMTGLMAGTPAVIIPTITERVSNARRLAAVGAGEVVMPVAGADGEKRIDVAEFGRKVSRVLSQPSYHQSARRVAESMRQFGGADAAAERIEEFAVALGL